MVVVEAPAHANVSMPWLGARQLLDALAAATLGQQVYTLFLAAYNPVAIDTSLRAP